MALSDKLNILRHDARLLVRAYRNTGTLDPRARYMVTIETTSVCNLACPLCPTGTGTLRREDRYLSWERFLRIRKITAPVVREYVMSMWGEPTFHPRLADMLEHIAPTPIWLSTNLNYGPERVDLLAAQPHVNAICSVDTIDPDAYPEYRVKGDWNLLVENLRRLVAGKCRVYPQFLVDRDTDRAPILDFCDRLGVDRRNVIIKQKRDNFRLDAPDKPLSGRCHAPYQALYFNCDGRLVPCCNNVRADLHMARVDDLEDFAALSAHPGCVAVRRQLARDKNKYPSCHNCPGEPIGELLDKYGHYLKRLVSRRPEDQCQRL